MTVDTKANLLTRANQIRQAVAGAENSASRVGGLLRDIVDSSLLSQPVAISSSNSASANAALIQAALDATGAGGAVQLPPGLGNVEITTVALSGGRKLWSWGGTTLKWVAAASTAMLTVTGTGCGIYNIGLNGNASAQVSNVVGVTLTTAPRFHMEGCEVTNFRYKFLLTDEGGELSPDGSVIGCNIHDMGTVTDCDIFGVRCSRWLFAGNRFKDITALGHCIRFGLYNAGPAAVVDSKVIGNSFNDSVEVGVVCEIYTQGVEIIGNTFRNLAQGVKCENAGSTVSGININNNEFRGLTLSTGFNWTVPGTYTNNRCYDCACGIELLKDAIVRGNYLENCGTSSEGAIHLFSGGSGRFDISGNTIVSPVGSGIVLGTANTECIGNTVYNVSTSGKYGIDVSGTNQNVCLNIIDTVAAGATGLRVVSTVTSSQVTGNKFLNITGSGLAVTNNANFLSCLVKDNAGVAPLSLDHTISSGAFSIGLSSVSVVMNTEGGAATDDLDTLTPTTNLPIGHIVILRDNSSSNDVTVKHNTGNIILVGGVDFAMLTSAYKIALMWSGTKWQELWRATA